MQKFIISAAALALVLGGCSSNNGNPVPPGGGGGSNTHYVQIELLSRPAVKEVFEPFNDHKLTNAVEPYNDPTIQADIVATENFLRPPNATAGSNYGTTLKSVLYPNTYIVNLNGSAPAGNDPEYFLSYEVDGSSFFGGRAPNDDVVGLELPILFGNLLSTLHLAPEDYEENDCLSAQNITPTVASTNTFPYLQAPH